MRPIGQSIMNCLPKLIVAKLTLSYDCALRPHNYQLRDEVEQNMEGEQINYFPLQNGGK